MSSSYNKYYDPDQVESDKKEFTITQLRLEAFELKQNKKDMNELKRKFQEMTAKYESLVNAKSKMEADFQGGLESFEKESKNLNFDIEVLSGELASIQDRKREIRADNQSVNQTINLKSSEVAKHKSQITQLNQDNEKLIEQNQDLKVQSNTLNLEIHSLTNKERELKFLNQDKDERIQRNKRIIADIENDLANTLKKNSDLERNIFDINNQIKRREENIEHAKALIQENKEIAQGLNREANGINKVNQTFKDETYGIYKAEQNEILKNKDVEAQIDRLDRLIVQKEDEISYQKRINEQSRKDYVNLGDRNRDLEFDIESCKTHLDNLTQQNTILNHELLKYSDQDENVRVILNRKSRVQDVVVKTEEKMRLSQHRLESTSRSPKKK